MAGSDIRVPTDDLVDRGVYLLDENESLIRFAAYMKDKKTFFGVRKTATEDEQDTTVLEEEGLYDPDRGIFGVVVPLEYTHRKVPLYIPLQKTIWTGSVWVDNNALSQFFIDLEMEEP